MIDSLGIGNSGQQQAPSKEFWFSYDKILSVKYYRQRYKVSFENEEMEVFYIN